MQLKLDLHEVADPAIPGGDALDPDARSVFVHALARAIAKTVRREENPDKEEHRDDR